MNESNNRLATEPVGKLLLSLALPTVLAQLVNMLYNMIDRMYVGRIDQVGTKALAGLGIAFPIIILISAFASLIGMGGAPRAAIHMGQKDNGKAEEILGNSIAFLTVLSLVLTVVFFLSKDVILMWFGASSDTLPYASSYLSIYLIGTIFVQFSLGLNQFITCQGFAKYSMATVLIGAIANIILDPIFIFVFHMGVAGAALATILSQGLSAIWVMYFLLGKRTTLKVRRKNLRISMKVMLPVLALGLSPFIMSATECLVQLTFNSGMQRYGSDDYVSAMAILFSLLQLINLPLSGLGQGAQPIISYNYGALNYDRVRQTFRILLTISLAFSIGSVAIVELFPHIFIGLFTNDADLISLAAPGLRIFLFGMALMGGQFACQQTFIALGQAKVSMFLALLRKIILLIPLAFILPLFVRPQTLGLYLAEPISDCISATTAMILFGVVSKKVLRHSKS